MVQDERAAGAGMKTDMSRRIQSEMLTLIRGYIEVAHYAPTYEEIRKMMGMTSRSDVLYHLKQLREAGYVTWRQNRARSIVLVNRDER